MTAPKALVRALRAYDPDLRARWSLALPCTFCGHDHEFWTIEKRCPPRMRQYVQEQPKTLTSARSRNIFEGWRQGYLFVMNVHPRLVDNVPLIIETLRSADLQVQGGLDAFSRQLDALEAAEEAQAERQIDHVVETLNKEAHDQIQWRSGNRVAVTTHDPKGPALAFEYMDGFYLRDRRSPAREEALAPAQSSSRGVADGE